jgi:WD40 repeat protein
MELLVGSVGGKICVWRAEGQWEHIKAMKGHKDLVTGLTSHPSGAIALSVSRDKQMRLWDLTRGSCAYQAPLATEGDLVGFFQSGDMYFISSSDPSKAAGSVVSLHSTKARLPCSQHSTLTRTGAHLPAQLPAFASTNWCTS